MDIKLKDKLLKLYELAKRGVDGERDNAEVLLNKMLASHNLTIEDIDQEVPRKRYYKYTTELTKKIINQIAYKLLQKREVYHVVGRKSVTVTVTDFQHVQILEMIDFHLSNFNKERKQFLEDFTNAYVQKHKLYRDSPDSETEERKPLTQKEKMAIFRMMNIKDNLSDESYVKRISF